MILSILSLDFSIAVAEIMEQAEQRSGTGYIGTALAL